VSALPIHFSRAYNRGCEKLALATSADGGKTWERSSTLVLPGPPDGIDVLSWRDPYVAPWPEMDALFGTAPDTHYHGMIAGSVPGVGPRLFLYRIPRTQLGSWTFLGTLGEFGFNESLPGAPWSGELGRNWEVGMFFTLRAASGRSTQYVLLNVEGCLLDEPARHPMWLACSFDADAAGKARMLPQASALLDDGCGYASSSFLDPTTGRRMMWTWVTEDDLPEAHYEPQGWSGCMSLPRELFQLDIPHVTGALHTPLKDIGSFSLETQSDGTALVSTLGIRLGDEVVRLREGAARRCNAETHVLSDASLRLPVASRSWELCATVKVDDATKSVGIVFAHNDCE
jgi:beta-fructofuranosidase